MVLRNPRQGKVLPKLLHLVVAVVLDLGSHCSLYPCGHVEEHLLDAQPLGLLFLAIAIVRRVLRGSGLLLGHGRYLPSRWAAD